MLKGEKEKRLFSDNWSDMGGVPRAPVARTPCTGLFHAGEWVDKGDLGGCGHGIRVRKQLLELKESHAL